MTRLSDTQQAIVDFIDGYVKEHGYSPSTREIGAGVGFSSTSTVHHHLSVLRGLGRLRSSPKSPRTLVIVEDEE